MLGAALLLASPLGAAFRHERNSYTVTPLVSDQPGMAPHTDGNLVNAWGLTAGPTTPWWVADNGTDKSTLYGGDGTPRALVVDVAGGPTGTAFNPTAGFVLPTGGKALFLFDSEDGVIRGWNGAQGTTAVVVKDRSDVGAIYKGLTVADTPAGPRLYAADFHNGRIDVFDGSFDLKHGGFRDPFLPRHYAPFNVQVIGDRVYVATRSRTRRQRMRRPAQAAVSSTPTTSRAACSRGSLHAATSTRRGGSRSLRRASGASRAIFSWGTSVTARSTRTRSARTTTSTRASITRDVITMVSSSASSSAERCGTATEGRL